MIVDPDGKGLLDHWQKTGMALLVGVILHVLYMENDKTLKGVSSFLSNPHCTIEETLYQMLSAKHDPEGVRGWIDREGNPTDAHPVIAESAREILNKAEQERSGVVSTAMSFLSLYRDPIVAKNTAWSDFTINDMVNGEKPLSLYLVVPASDKDRLKPLIRLLINQIVRKLVEKMDYDNGRAISPHRYRLLLLIDEFSSLGKLDIFEESLAFIASYGLKAFLIIQDLSQLQKAYGKEESIIGNCHIRVAFAPNRLETAQMISDMIGVTTIERGANSYSGSRFSVLLSKVSTSIQPIQRKLLTPDEVMRLQLPIKNKAGDIETAGDMLIFVSGHAPIMGKQILYFIDPEFLNRARIPTAESDILYSRPVVEILPLPKRAETTEIAGEWREVMIVPEAISVKETFNKDEIFLEEIFDDEVIFDNEM
jgi:type IV secretion system protein VirD4